MIIMTVLDATEIFEALQNNECLKVLDLSFNPIGSMNAKTFSIMSNLKQPLPDDEFIKKEPKLEYLLALKQMFIQNTSLIHCDFSHCGLSKYECEVMNEGLKKNHTILGIHMVGNKMNADSLGFLKSDELVPSLSHIAPRIDNTLNIGHLNENKITLNASSN